MRAVLTAISAVFLTVALVAAGAGSGAAQTRALTTEKDLEATKQELVRLTGDLSAKITAAEAALRDVSNMDEATRESAVNDFFRSMKEQVRTVLEKLNDNSPLMDAMEDAKTKAVVLKKWFERQPADYTNRDQSIARLDKAVGEYEALRGQVRDGHSEALNQLAQLGAAQQVVLQEMKIGKVETSIVRVREVVTSLSALSSKLASVASAQLPQSAATVAQQ